MEGVSKKWKRKVEKYFKIFIRVVDFQLLQFLYEEVIGEIGFNLTSQCKYYF